MYKENLSEKQKLQILIGMKEELDMSNEEKSTEKKESNMIEGHIFETDIIIKNLQLGRNGVQKKPNPLKYYKKTTGYGVYIVPINHATEVRKLIVELDINTIIVEGYTGKNYYKYAELANELTERIWDRFFISMNDCICEVTDTIIRITIERFEDNPTMFDMRDYGDILEEYIGFIHQSMGEVNINRGNVKLIFNNFLLVTQNFSR